MTQENSRIGWVILIGLVAFPFLLVALGVYMTLAIGGNADPAAITTGIVMALVLSVTAVAVLRQVASSN